MFTGAAFFLPFLPESVFDQTMALSLHLFVISTQVPGVPERLPYGVALVLIAHRAGDERGLHHFAHVSARQEEVVIDALAPPRTEVSVADLTIRYGSKTALSNVTLDIAETRDLRHHRASQQRQDFLLACAQPHGRVHARHALRRRGEDRRQGRPHRGATPTRFGGASAWCFRLPVGLPLSVYDNVALRPGCRACAEGRSRRNRREVAAPGRAVGRGQGPAEGPGQPALGRAAAAADDRPGPVARTRSSCCSTSSRSRSTP